MTDIDSFRIRYVVEIIQELFQVKDFFMEHLNHFNIIAGIQNFFWYSALGWLNATSLLFFVWPLI